MAFIINGVKIKEKDDYVQLGNRTKCNSTILETYYSDLKNLSKTIHEPMSVILDNMIIYFQENPKELDKLIKMCKNYG
jgi:hypothetical protein